MVCKTANVGKIGKFKEFKQDCIFAKSAAWKPRNDKTHWSKQCVKNCEIVLYRETNRTLQAGVTRLELTTIMSSEELLHWSKTVKSCRHFKSEERAAEVIFKTVRNNRNQLRNIGFRQQQTTKQHRIITDFLNSSLTTRRTEEQYSPRLLTNPSCNHYSLFEITITSRHLNFLHAVLVKLDLFKICTWHKASRVRHPPLKVSLSRSDAEYSLTWSQFDFLINDHDLCRWMRYHNGDWVPQMIVLRYCSIIDSASVPTFLE